MGFDNECILNIQNLAGEYFCPVCRMLVYPDEALQSQCTHLYCKPCLTYVVATTRACPYDGYLVTLEDSKPLLQSNKTLAETIANVAVHCLYHRSGCTWQGPLSDCPSHCSACAFGNSPVVCNRCAVQIVHRQVQEHAQTCPCVPSHGLTAEGTQSSAVSTSTNQMQATVQGAATSSQAQASHLAATVLPGQVPNQPANATPNLSLFDQAVQPVTDLSHQQQHYRHYAGYDPYRQHYQQHQLIQLPAQQYPQSQTISAGYHQNQPHLMISPQSHIHLQRHTLGQPLPNQPQLHSQLHPQQVCMPQYQQNHPQALAQPQPHHHQQARPSVQLQQNSQVHPHTYPLQANNMNHYLSISHTHVDHSFPLQSQSGITQQPSGYSYPQEGLQQQQQRIQVQNQAPQPLMNPSEIQAVNQQNPLAMTSSSQHQIVPTVQQHNISHQEPVHMLHHRPPLQAIGQPLAPQHPQQQQVPLTTHASMHSQLSSNIQPSMPQQSQEILQPQQNMAFPHNELPRQSQSQIGRASKQLQKYPVSNEDVTCTGLHKQGLTQSGSQFEPNNMSAANIAATGRLEGRETSVAEEKHGEALIAMSASRNKVPSDENGVKEERANDSEEGTSVGRSGSILNDLKEGDPDKIKSKRMDFQNIQLFNEKQKDEVAGSFPFVRDSDRRMMVNASPYVFGGHASMPSSLIPNSRNSLDERQPYMHDSGSCNVANLTPGSLKAGPDSLHAFDWCDERLRAPQDKMLLQKGSVRLLREDLLQLPRPPNVESELLCKQGLFSSMPYERDSFGFRIIPRPLDKALYGSHHNKHLLPGAFIEDNRLDSCYDFQSVASMYGHHFGVPPAIPNRELSNVSAHAIRYGSRADFRLGIDGRDQLLLAPVKPLNLSADPADLSLISSASSNLLPQLHRGSFSWQTRNAELSKHDSISSLGEVGYRSNLLLTENRFHKGDLGLSDNIRKRKAATMGWCRICKVDCDTVEGLDLHSQTREHQRMSMDMVLKIKQQNSKRQNMTSSDFDPLPRKQLSQDYPI